jgi:hypothetical protein
MQEEEKEEEEVQQVLHLEEPQKIGRLRAFSLSCLDEVDEAGQEKKEKKPRVSPKGIEDEVMLPPKEDYSAYIIALNMLKIVFELIKNGHETKVPRIDRRKSDALCVETIARASYAQHTCLFCHPPKHYPQHSPLEIHLNAHLGIKNYACTGCSRTFVQKVQRDSHARCHTNEKPYPCTFIGCKRVFKDIAGKNRHLRTAHGLLDKQQRNDYTKQRLLLEWGSNKEGASKETGTQVKQDVGKTVEVGNAVKTGARPIQ